MKYIYRWLRADREEIDSALYDTVGEAQAARDKHASFGAICSETVIEVPDDYERYDPDKDTPKTVRIISDGSPGGTKVFDAEGKLIPGIRRVRIDISADQAFVVAEIDIIGSRLDVVARGTTKHIKESSDVHELET